MRPVAGGDLNEAYCVVHHRQKYFVKYHPHPVPGQFAVEAQGLQLLSDAGVVSVPRVHAVHPEGLVLEWLEADPASRDSASETLGRQLALLHQKPVPGYALPIGNVVGIRQDPGPVVADLVTFYRTYRLAPLLDALTQSGTQPAHRLKRLHRLMAHLDDLLDPRASRPSLLHGDLWSGNWMATRRGPYLVDPAAYWGDREMEIAMTELFARFPLPFYHAYQEVWPLDPGYAERRPLYQLYPLLVHLYLFGEAWGPSVDRILAHYTG